MTADDEREHTDMVGGSNWQMKILIVSLTMRASRQC
jgi:hypothetical protein